MDWKSLIGTVAPWIGTALGGPLGGAAIGALADALGLPEKTEATIKSALSAVTPEQMMSIKNADQAFSVKMKELGYANEEKLASLAVDDRNSARQREMTVRDSTPRMLAYAITVGFFGILAYLLTAGKPPVGGDAMLVMLGSLGTAWTAIIGYYFGSSAESSHKTTLLAKADSIK